jgi:hypothetical protein
MKVLLTALFTAAAIGATAMPAVAQPLDIIVPGGLTLPQGLNSDFPDRRIVRTPVTPGGNFDPGQASINALAISKFYPPRNFNSFNWDRALTLNATGGSLLEHQLLCQATYVTYELASDTYIGGDGIPRPCRL